MASLEQFYAGGVEFPYTPGKPSGNCGGTMDAAGAGEDAMGGGGLEQFFAPAVHGGAYIVGGGAGGWALGLLLLIGVVCAAVWWRFIRVAPASFLGVYNVNWDNPGAVAPDETDAAAANAAGDAMLGRFLISAASEGRVLLEIRPRTNGLSVDGARTFPVPASRYALTPPAGKQLAVRSTPVDRIVFGWLRNTADLLAADGTRLAYMSRVVA